MAQSPVPQLKAWVSVRKRGHSRSRSQVVDPDVARAPRLSSTEHKQSRHTLQTKSHAAPIVGHSSSSLIASRPTSTRHYQSHPTLYSACSAMSVVAACILMRCAPARAAVITSVFPTSNVAPGDVVTVQGSGFLGPTVCNPQYNLMLECSAYVSKTADQPWSATTQFPALRCTYISSSSISVRVPHTSLGSNYLTIIEAPTFASLSSTPPSTPQTSTPITSPQTVAISIPSSMKVYAFTGAPVPVAVKVNVPFVKVSLWGAPGQGGRQDVAQDSGGKGGLTEGFLALNAGDSLTITVGGNNGYNGGGTTGADGSACAAGGGATDLRKNGNLLEHRIMVAGGGGGFGQSWAGYVNSSCGGYRMHITGHTFGIPNACCHMNIGHDGVTWAGGGPPGGEPDDRLDDVTFPRLNPTHDGGSGGSGTQSRGGTLRFGLSTPNGVEGSLGQGGKCIKRCITNMGHQVGGGGGGGGYYGGSGGPDCDGAGYGYFGGGGSGYVSNEVIHGSASSAGGLVRPYARTGVVDGFAYVTELLESPPVALSGTPTAASVRYSLSVILLSTQLDLASAIEWAQGLRSLAASAASACMQQSACVTASSRDECQLSSADSPASHFALGSDYHPPDSTCTREQSDAYRAVIDNMQQHFSRHTAIINPLLLSVTHLNALSPSAPLPLLHALTQAAQALRHSIAMHYSLLLALAARPGPVSKLSPSPATDPVLQSFAGQGALAELLAAQKAASDLAASVAD